MKTCLTIIVVTIPLLCDGQTVLQYAYDSSGNRISRTISNNSRSLLPNDMEADYTELLSEGSINALINKDVRKIKVDISSWNEGSFGSIAVYSLTGREVESFAIKDNTTTLHLDRLPHGVYILSITADGEKKSCKFTL